MTSSPELQGYCPVAYFVAGEALEGSPEFSSLYEGKTYHFVSNEAKEQFESEPQKFLPAYGGRCAFGMSIEKDFEPCPKNFKIIDNRLHLFLRNNDTDALELWNKENENQCVANADAHWASLQG